MEKVKVGLFVGVSFGVSLGLLCSNAYATDYIMLNLPSHMVSAFPRYPVYVYETNSHGKKHQIDFITGSVQPAFIGKYIPNKTSRNYTLYYADESRGMLLWSDCAIALNDGSIDQSHTTCPNVGLTQLANSNVYSLGVGANQHWVTPVAEPEPIPHQTFYHNRSVIFTNDTKYNMIQIGESCNGVENALCQTTSNMTRIVKGESYTLPIGGNPLNSAAFYVSAFQEADGTWVNTGGHHTNDPQAYATLFEVTFQPVIKNRHGIEKAAETNVDVSAKDGFNFAINVYPETPAYCTYTKTINSIGYMQAGHYSQENAMAKLIPTTAMSLNQLCASSSQLPVGKKKGWNLAVLSDNHFAGCYSPCSYAKANKLDSATIDAYCCAGPNDLPSTCPAPATASYTTNMHQFSKHVYAYAYDDTNADLSCDASSSLIVDFVSSAPTPA